MIKLRICLEVFDAGLLDTHIILWALTNDEKLPQKARTIISGEENKICYSTASVWR